MDVILFALNLSWKILVVCMGWMLFKYVLKNGSGTFRDFLDTVSIALRTFGHWIRKTCLNYLKRESAKRDAEDKPIEEAASESAKENEPGTVAMTYDEFKKAVNEKRIFYIT